MHQPRYSGILSHITSLPGPYGIGDLGPEAYRFADFLVRSRQQIWQVLPLVPVGHGYSPYSSPSTFAGNPLLISPDVLRSQHLLAEEDLAEAPGFSEDCVEFERVIPFKRALLVRAFERFEAGEYHDVRADQERFVERTRYWLDDYALFMALKEAHGGASWTEWPADLVRREPEALDLARSTYAREIRMHKFWQFLFDRQWCSLKDYCNQRGVRIFGDLPIYVAHDSADVWANQRLFFLEENGHPTVVAGVPPDYFSETGQRWGNPIYRWDVMRENGFDWWTQRFSNLLTQVDILRLDHFRGFEAYWEIPGSEPTAVNGKWVEGPGGALFSHIHDRLGLLPIVAEDLGLITPGVTALMDEFVFPGMAVLHFAFDSGPDCNYLPHHFKRNLVAYTGTHDNDTTVGWWEEQVRNNSPAARYVRAYLDIDAESERDIHWAFIRLLLSSVAFMAVVPIQDLLGLGSEARMNTPGMGQNNWAWRFRSGMLTDEACDRLRFITETYGRIPPEKP